MGFKFHKRCKLGKGTTLNIGKKGASVTQKAGIFSFNSNGRLTINLPGTGLSYSTNIFKKKKK